MDPHEVIVNVGLGFPVDGNMVFNVHFMKPQESVSWQISLSYLQLCKIDSFISSNTDKIKHSIFPILKSDEANKYVEFLNDHQNHMHSYHHHTSHKLENPISQKIVKFYNMTVDMKEINKEPKLGGQNSSLFTKIEKTRQLIENWMHTLLLRLHAMPEKVIRDIIKVTHLPYGPLDDIELERIGIIFTPNSNAHIIVGPKIFGQTRFQDPKKLKSNPMSSSVILQKELYAEQTCPPLLKISVERDKIGEKGKLQYKISIHHSRNPVIAPPYIIYRNFDQFVELNTNVDTIDGQYMYTGFPMLSSSSLSKEWLGLGLSETDQSIRTRALDSWLRELCCNYKIIRPIARRALRLFLKINTNASSTVNDGNSNNTTEDDDLKILPLTGLTAGSSTAGGDNDVNDGNYIKISIQNRLSLGLIEGPRARVSQITSLFPDSKNPNTASNTTGTVGAVEGSKSVSNHHRFTNIRLMIANTVVMGEHPLMVASENSAATITTANTTNTNIQQQQPLRVMRGGIYCDMNTISIHGAISSLPNYLNNNNHITNMGISTDSNTAGNTGIEPADVFNWYSQETVTVSTAPTATMNGKGNEKGSGSFDAGSSDSSTNSSNNNVVTTLYDKKHTLKIVKHIDYNPNLFR